MDAITTIVVLTIVALLSWLGPKCFNWLKIRGDEPKVYSWLKENTKDEPGETHKSLFEISDGTRFTEERARTACLRSKRIMQSTERPGHYSIWRKEQQSIYGKNDVKVF